MNNKYINKNTFEITDDVFEVDEGIAETISILNKKGYYTLFSCSGHIKDPRLYEKYHISKNNDWGNNMPDSYVVDETSDSYNLLKPYTFTTIYIKFSKNYNFNDLPIGFILHEDCIEKRIEYYTGTVKKKLDDIDKEIKEENNLLLKWVKELPYEK